MKHEWRKREKKIYLPKAKPEIVDIPTFQFITIDGAGNPGGKLFSECVGALYSLAYGIKMSAKKKMGSHGFYDFTVYPLEGIWDITEEAKKDFSGTINKDDLVYKLMIRQPDFNEADYLREILNKLKSKSSNRLLEKLAFEEITDGKCIQMLHVGSYDNEPESFAEMEKFAAENGVKRLSKVHREIYLSDARKVATEKLKTVLRFQLEQN